VLRGKRRKPVRNACAAHAEMRVSNVFGDHLVLQRKKPVRIWGWTEPGQEVTLSFAGQSKAAGAEADGRWIMQFDPHPASFEGREMVIACGVEKRALEDVLVGEVERR
jgi:sialate O-acetylesterase